MDVSICIVNWNTKEYLLDCLKSISEKTTGLDYEVIVVDNDSDDGTVEAVESSNYPVVIIAPGENLGFSKGCNLGAEHASGEYIFFLNPDTVLVTNVVNGMYEWLRNNPHYGAVGCKLLNDDGTIQYTCATTYPSPREELVTLLMLHRIFPRSRVFHSRALEYWDHSDSREVDCLSGAAFMLPRDLFSSCGGFDAELFMYGEDVDLCYRIRKMGHRLFYLAEEAVMHFSGKSVENIPKANYAAVMQKNSNAKFFEKNFGSGKALLYRTAVFLGCSVRLAVLSLGYPAMHLLYRRLKDRLRFQMSRCMVLIKWSLGFHP